MNAQFSLWLLGALCVAVVFGVLGAPLLAFADIAAVLSPNGYFVVTGALWVVLVLGLWQVLRFGAAKTPNNKPFVWQNLAFWLLVLLGLPTAFAFKAALQVQADATRVQLLGAHSPLMVTADVAIYELSDSVSPYRQKAVLTNLRVPTEKRGKLANPFAQLPAAPPPPLVYPSQLTVLLSKKTTANEFAAAYHNAAALPDVGESVPMTLILTALKNNKNASFDEYHWLKTRHIDANARILTIDGAPTAADVPIKEWFFVKLQRLRSVYRQAFLANFSENLLDGGIKNNDGKNSHKNSKKNDDNGGDDAQSGTADPANDDTVHLSRNELEAQTAVVLSLLTGDRAFLDSDLKNLYQYGGISHLLAISGAHVVFLAFWLAFLTIKIVDLRPQCYRKIPRAVLFWAVMVSVAFIYASFTGLDVPALRTVLMLFLVGAARLLLLRTHVFAVLIVAALLLVFADAYTVWQAGFWLSFGAVALLLLTENWLGDRHTAGHAADLTTDNTGQFFGLAHSLKDWQLKLARLALLQVYIFVAMLPLSLLFFGKISPLGALVNLFAVNLFGLLIVPLVLLGGVSYPLIAPLARALWQAAANILDVLHVWLSFLRATFGETWWVLPMSTAAVVLAVMVVLGALNRLPSVPRRLAIVPFLALLLSLTKSNNDENIVVLDVNDADILAVLVNDKDAHWLLLGRAPISRPIYRKKGMAFAELNSYEYQQAQALADALFIALKKAHIHQLSGVVVQTPIAKNVPLVHAATQIADQIPTNALYAPESVHLKNHTWQACRADQKLTAPRLTLAFITTPMPENAGGCAVLVTGGATVLGADYARVLIENSASADFWATYLAQQADESATLSSELAPDFVLSHRGSFGRASWEGVASNVKE